mmetsp:Transcript_37338/g.87603  ORF Transcript_37338/g.87603 Transcript_37338/m.87603 type:complete len:239 (-) Transcript_37338:268-984(-)
MADEGSINSVPWAESPFLNLKLGFMPSPRKPEVDVELEAEADIPPCDGDLAFDPSVTHHQTSIGTCTQSLRTKPSSRRQQSKLWQQEKLKNFLHKHRFVDACEPSTAWMHCYAMLGGETLYPIHVAAREGDPEILRLLLQARADPEQKTSCGRTAEAVARDADVFGSHKEVVDMLRGGLKVLGLREALSVMIGNTKSALNELEKREDSGLHKTRARHRSGAILDAIRRRGMSCRGRGS